MTDDDFRKLPESSLPPDASSLHYGLEGVRDARVPVVVQMMVSGSKNFEEIAAHFGITPRALWNLRHKHNLDELVARIQLENMEAGNAILRRGFVAAAKSMMELAERAVDEKVRKEASQYLLERRRQDDELVRRLERDGYDIGALPDAELDEVIEAEADEG